MVYEFWPTVSNPQALIPHRCALRKRPGPRKSISAETGDFLSRHLNTIRRRIRYSPDVGAMVPPEFPTPPPVRALAGPFQ